MNREEAETLCARILREGAPYQINAEVMADRVEGVFVVMTEWDGTQALQQNEDVWTSYFNGVKTCLEMLAGGRR